MILMGVAIFIWDFLDTQVGNKNVLQRNDVGQGDYQEEMKISSNRHKERFSVEVEERKLSQKEVEQLFKNARKEIDKTFLGENKSKDKIQSRVLLLNTCQDGNIHVDWSFDGSDLIGSDGEINNGDLRDKVIVVVTAELSYGDYKNIYSFPVNICPLETGSRESMLKKLRRSIATASLEDDELVLPKEIDGNKIVWKKIMPLRGLSIMLLGMVVYILVPFLEKMELRQRDRKRRENLLKAYPEILTQLSLLLQVGISLPEAIQRICRRYERRLHQGAEREEAYDLIVQWNRETRDGVGVIQAIENFGKRAGIREYRKLAILLSQSERHGNGNIVELLEKEDAECFEMRKMMAKKEGEEASTKLLLPMMGMLGLVLVILIFPAMKMLATT